MLTLLVSDLHLSARRPETADLFLAFLAGPARDAGAFYVLGDLFDYWAGDDDLADPFNRRICDALAALSASGTRSHFLRGNRDFLAGSAFTAATGMTLLPDLSVQEIDGQPTLLLHGDTLCTDDVGYQAFRATVRADEWQRDFLARPLAERRASIEQLRQRSEAEKQAKPDDLMDTNAEAVAAAFRHHDVCRMIHGHTHRQAHHRHPVNGHDCQRWVLGDWSRAGNCLRCGDGEWTFATITPSFPGYRVGLP